MNVSLYIPSKDSMSPIKIDIDHVEEMRVTAGGIEVVKQVKSGNSYWPRAVGAYREWIEWHERMDG